MKVVTRRRLLSLVVLPAAQPAPAPAPAAVAAVRPPSTAPSALAPRHAALLGNLFVELAKAKPPSAWIMPERQYAQALLSAYDAAVCLVDDALIQAVMAEALAFPDLADPTSSDF